MRNCDRIASGSGHLLPRRWPLMVPHIPYWSCPHLGHLEMRGRWVPGLLSSVSGSRHRPLPATARSSQGGSRKSGHSRDGLQLCHLQKSLRESDMPGQWQVSKALGVLETLVPPGLWRTRRTLPADDVSSPVRRVSPAPDYSCQPVLVLCSPDIVLLEYLYLAKPLLRP